MKPIIPFALLGALLAVGAVNAAETTPVGYTVTQCLSNSDTIVGTPLRISATAAGALTADPSATTGTSVLTSSSAAFPAVAGTHYVKFKSGASDGKWYEITANDATTLTVNLNGDTLAAVNGDTFEVLKFWTLGELFNPATATGDPLTTPHAIVSSAGTTAGTRRTEVLLPDQVTVGTNLAPSATYYVTGGVWRRQGSTDPNFNSVVLWPDTYFIIRHPSTVTSPTTYTIVGEVEENNFAIPLSTQATVKQDNFVALPRPIDISLNDLGLGNTAAFMSSAGTTAGTRRDELLVFDNAVAARNKSASATYYYVTGTGWRRQGDATTDQGPTLIKGGFGFIVRKYQTGTAGTVFWNNAPTY